MSQPMTSPTTPTARKKPMEPISSGFRTPASGQKQQQKRKPKIDASPSANALRRKVKTEHVSPTNATPKGKGAGAHNPSNKKRKVTHDDNKEADDIVPSIEDEPRLNLPTPFQTPIGSPSPVFGMSQQQQYPQQQAPQYLQRPQHQYPRQQQPHEQQQHSQNSSLGNVSDQREGRAAANDSQPSNNSQRIGQPTSQSSLDPSNIGISYFDNLIYKMFNVAGVPKETEIIMSSMIDQYTYKIFQHCLVINNGVLHERANLFGAMLNELKLRTLAKLCLLPGWWFIRTRVVEYLQMRRFPIDDFLMQTLYMQAESEMKIMLEKSKKLSEQA